MGRRGYLARLCVLVSAVLSIRICSVSDPPYLVSRQWRLSDYQHSMVTLQNSPILEERVEVLRTTIAALEGQVTSLFTAFEELHTSCADAQDVQSLWANVRQGLEVAEELQVEVAALRQHITRQSLYSVPPEKGVDADSEEDAEDQEINSALFRNYSGSCTFSVCLFFVDLTNRCMSIMMIECTSFLVTADCLYIL